MNCHIDFRHMSDLAFCYKRADLLGPLKRLSLALSFALAGPAQGQQTVLNLRDLDGSNGVSLQGTDIGGRSGLSVAGGGDINGDGFQDFAIGAPFAEYGEFAGKVFVVFGGRLSGQSTARLSDISAGDGYVVTGGAIRTYAGSKVDIVRDMNGDGLADLLVQSGAPEGQDGGTYVVFGGSSTSNVQLDNLDPKLGITIAGSWASGVGDINGDGLSDIGFQCSNAELTRTDACFLFGSSAPFPALVSRQYLTDGQGLIVSQEAMDTGSFLIDGAGDFNGDGVQDFLFRVGCCEVGLVFGSQTGLPNVIDPKDLNGLNGLNFSVTGLSDLQARGAGDINADGIDDLVMGARRFGVPPFRNRGAVFVVYGSRSPFPATFQVAGLSPAAGTWIVGAKSGDSLGRSLDAAGDVNGDGIDDIIVGATGIAVGGGAYVLFGGPGSLGSAAQGSLVSALDGIVLLGTVRTDYAGSSISGAGDVNGDGLADVIIGAPLADPGFSTEGESYVVYGNNPNRIYANGFER